MKKQNLKWIGIGVAAIIVIALISNLCSGEPEQEPIPETRDIVIEKSEVYGENSNVFSVVTGKYTLIYDGSNVALKVKLRLNHTVESGLEISGPDLILKKASGTNVANSDYNSSLSLQGSERSKMESFLHSAPGTEMEIIFTTIFCHAPRAMMTESAGFVLNDLELTKPEPEEKKPESVSDVINDAMDEVKDDMDSDEDLKKAMDDTEKALKLTGDLLDLSKSALKTLGELE